MEPDSMVSTETPDSECFESNDNEITWNNVSEEKDKEENEQTDCTEEVCHAPVNHSKSKYSSIRTVKVSDELNILDVN